MGTTIISMKMYTPMDNFHEFAAHYQEVKLARVRPRERFLNPPTRALPFYEFCT